jgi:hypothetical protein
MAENLKKKFDAQDGLTWNVIENICRFFIEIRLRSIKASLIIMPVTEQDPAISDVVNRTLTALI